jgi:hypothetical protein
VYSFAHRNLAQHQLAIWIGDGGMPCAQRGAKMQLKIDEICESRCLEFDKLGLSAIYQELADSVFIRSGQHIYLSLDCARVDNAAR